MKCFGFIFKTENTETADDSRDSEVIVVESGVPILRMAAIVGTLGDLLAISCMPSTAWEKMLTLISPSMRSNLKP